MKIIGKVSSLHNTLGGNPKTSLQNILYLQSVSSISTLCSSQNTVTGGTRKILYTETLTNQNTALKYHQIESKSKQ